MIDDFKSEFICGRKFQTIANRIWDTDRKDDPKTFQDGEIIWCKTDFVLSLFHQISDHKNKYKLITHNSDFPITQSMFKLRPKCITKWYAENANYKNIDLIPLPLGLENDMGPSKGAYTNYEAIERNLNAADKNEDKVYCNFTMKNNPCRIKVVNALIKNKVILWEDRKDYHAYCNSMSKYRFVASPIGNGLDCHRTWEALYMGCIPIVEKHFMYDMLGNLPIIQVSDWGEVTSEWLEDTLQMFKKSRYDWNYLKIAYWTERIK